MARATRTALIFAALFLAPVLTSTAQVSVEVQLHGASLVGSLHSQLTAVEEFEFRADTREILALERVTGRRLYTIIHPDYSCLTFTGEIVKLQSPTLLQREIVRREVDRFNSSASVGTMYFDERTGEVWMRHHLDPGQTGVRSMVDVARRFGRQVMIEQAKLGASAGL